MALPVGNVAQKGGGPGREYADIDFYGIQRGNDYSQSFSIEEDDTTCIIYCPLNGG